MERFDYNLIINGQKVYPGDKIRIISLDGHTGLSNLFEDGIIDEAILTVNKHKVFNTLVFKPDLRKNGQPSKYIINEPYANEDFEITIQFAKDLQSSLSTVEIL